jgi:hypothetical protein
MGLGELSRTAPQRATDARVPVWTAVSLLMLIVGGFAYTQRQDEARLTEARQSPIMLIGLPGMNGAVPSEAPGGNNTVCTEEALDPTALRWSCLVWEVNVRQLPIVEPPRYVGRCTHLRVDPEAARWTCLGPRLAQPQELPPLEQVPTPRLPA